MDVFEELANKILAAEKELPTYAKNSLQQNEDEIMRLQREQLFSGKRADGQDIRPYYSEDLQSNGGFFKTPQSAKNYTLWKANMSYPSSAPRQMDAPNLYINEGSGAGRFHKELGVEFTSDSMIIKGTTPYADKIVDKYGLDTFGLSDESFIKLYPDLLDLILLQLKTYFNGTDTN